MDTKEFSFLSDKDKEGIRKIVTPIAHYVKGSNGEYYCSHCKRIDDKYSVANYCWHCGARMMPFYGSEDKDE